MPVGLEVLLGDAKLLAAYVGTYRSVEATELRIAVEEGREARGSLSVGICGEHGGDPDSIALCEELRLDYVSCSPYRVPAARLAAAHAKLASVERDR